MQTRRWRKDGEDSDRFSTEIIVVPGNRVQFYDKPNGNGAQGAGRFGRRGRRRGRTRQRRSDRRVRISPSESVIVPPSRLGGRRFGVGPPFAAEPESPQCPLSARRRRRRGALVERSITQGERECATTP